MLAPTHLNIKHTNKPKKKKKRERNEALIWGNLLATWAARASWLRCRRHVLQRQQRSRGKCVLVCGIERFVTVVVCDSFFLSFLLFISPPYPHKINISNPPHPHPHSFKTSRTSLSEHITGSAPLFSKWDKTDSSTSSGGSISGGSDWAVIEFEGSDQTRGSSTWQLR